MDLKSKYFLIDCGTLLTNRKYQKDLDSVVERSKDVGKYIRRAVSSDPKTPEILSITLIFTYALPNTQEWLSWSAPVASR